MTDQQMVLRAANDAQRILEEYLEPRPQNDERILAEFGGSSRTVRFDCRRK